MTRTKQNQTCNVSLTTVRGRSRNVSMGLNRTRSKGFCVVLPFVLYMHARNQPDDTGLDAGATESPGSYSSSSIHELRKSGLPTATHTPIDRAFYGQRAASVHGPGVREMTKRAAASLPSRRPSTPATSKQPEKNSVGLSGHVVAGFCGTWHRGPCARSLWGLCPLPADTQRSRLQRTSLENSVYKCARLCPEFIPSGQSLQ